MCCTIVCATMDYVHTFSLNYHSYFSRWLRLLLSWCRFKGVIVFSWLFVSSRRILPSVSRWASDFVFCMSLKGSIKVTETRHLGHTRCSYLFSFRLHSLIKDLVFFVMIGSEWSSVAKTYTLLGYSRTIFLSTCIVGHSASLLPKLEIWIKGTGSSHHHTFLLAIQIFTK
jgi:hypothetical protein